uniref:Copine C-terminal domain-containing protein n=1 Tax=Arcella intermedia TaxID=1963864 RepID=A0A6B2LEJ0_9EUKA
MRLISSQKRKAKLPSNIESLEDVVDELRYSGPSLRYLRPILAVDFSSSCAPMHARARSVAFVKEEAAGGAEGEQDFEALIGVFGSMFGGLNADHPKVHAFGFGDASSPHSIFPFFLSRNLAPSPCLLQDIKKRYAETSKTVLPASTLHLAPLIRQAVQTQQEQSGLHLLFIITGGQLADPKETQKALQEASKVPLMIVVVGVGEGPWDGMVRLEDAEGAFNNVWFSQFDGRAPQQEKLVFYNRLALIVIEMLRNIKKLKYTVKPQAIT